MKTSSEPGAHPVPDRTTAWACTLTNALTLPGLGSITAGRRVGYAQGVLALVGFGLSLYWLGKTVLTWMAEGELPAEVNGTLLVGLAGICLYIAAWLWAFATSLSLLAEARSHAGADRENAHQEPPQERGLQSAGTRTGRGTSLRAEARASDRCTATEQIHEGQDPTQRSHE